MKLVYIANAFPKLSETFILGQITNLIDRGHDVEIISLDEPTEESFHEDIKKYNLIEKTHYLKQSQSSLGFKPEEKLVSSLIFTDLIHAHFATCPASWALKISKEFGIPFVVTTHAYDIYINPDKEDLKVKFENAARIITISDYNKNYLTKLLGKEFWNHIDIIRCGIDLSKFSFIKRQPSRKIKILYVGRLVEKKGPSYVIKAFKQALRENPNIELRIIGDGPLTDEIYQLTKELKLGNRVKMLGAQPQSMVLKEMELADIFFLPSLTAENGDREGAPVSILEAEATGLPIVSTIHTGIPEIVINGKTGFLVQEKDTNAMAKSLNKLIKNPELRNAMGKAGRTYVETHYDRRKEIDELEKLFHKLIQNGTIKPKISQNKLGKLRMRVRYIANLLYLYLTQR